ncbi:MAG: serine hydrolase [Clostridia bacterium]|nr:serine hydrolase [Clostridia bacterium]
MANTVTLERCTPESVGISSADIIALMDTFKRMDIENHSFMILRHGKVCAEAWAKPMAAEIPHALYSFSKSFSATAIGFAIEEKVIVPATNEPLSLDTRLKDIFPEEFAAKKKPHPYDEELKLRHMLRMQSGKQMNLMADKAKIDWVEDYINAPFNAKPGTYWNYCNENSFMLCAAIRKLTDMTVNEYLSPRLYEPLGIETPLWETDQNGTEAGGWGMYLKTEDMAKFILCYVQGGKFNGEQVIPARWVEEASKKQVDNSIELQTDNKAGYGYHFWMNEIGGFRADGMFSQHGLGLPEYDAVIITTSACPIEQKDMDAICSIFPAAFSDEPLPENPEVYAELQQRCADYALEKLPKRSRRPLLEQRINKKVYHINKKPVGNISGFPASMLAMPITFMSTVKTGNIDRLRFVFQENELRMNWVEQDGKIKECVPIGLDGEYRYGKLKLGPVPFTTAGIGCWNEDGTLSISLRPLEAVSARTMTIRFEEDSITVKMGETPAVSTIAEFLVAAFEVMVGNKFLVKSAEQAFKVVPKVLDPTLHGKMM